LKGGGISDEDYEHAQKVWKAFNMETFRDYHNLYNTADVLQLADGFQNFRNTFIKTYKLDPLWYYTLPGYAWDLCLKATGIRLELLTDMGMVDMFQAGIRGGISSIMHRYAKANNKYMGDDYDPSKDTSFIKYLDANNLNGWAMNQLLPTVGFKWLDDDELKNWRDSPCVLEVDLDYPEELHDLHNE
jgi:hypothetical protein